MKKVLYFTLLSFLFQVTFSQNHKIDSLKKVVLVSKIDTLKINATIELGYEYAEINLDSAFKHAETAQLSIEKISPLRKYTIYKLLSHLNQKKGRIDLALEYALKRLKVAEDNAGFTKQKATSFERIAWLYERLNKRDKIFEYYEKALAEAKLSKDKDLITDVLSTGSNLYFNIQNYDKALEIMNEQAKVDTTFKTDCWYFAGIGDIYRNKKNLDKADEYYLKAIEMAKGKFDTMSLMTLYNNYALIPLERKNYALSIVYYQKAKDIATLKNMPDDVNDYNSIISSVYFKANDYKNSLIYLTEAIAFYEKQSRLGVLSDLMNRKSEIHFLLKQYKEAYEALQRANDYKEQVSNSETQNKLAEIEASVLGAKKDKEISLINKDREFQKIIRNIFIFGSAIFLLLGILIFRSLLLNKKKNKIISEQKQLVDEKQKEIIDSIHYAKRIQTALITSEKYIDKSLKKLQDKKT